MASLKNLLLIIIFILSLNTVFSQELPVFTETEKQWISEQDTVYFGYDPDWRPYQFINERGEHDGIMESILDIVRDRTGLVLEPYPDLDWPQSMEALKVDQVQFLPATGVTQDRLEYMSFSEPYMSFPFVIINEKGGEFLGEIADLKGQKIALPTGYLITEHIERDYPDLEITYTDNLEQALLLIMADKVDATMAALPVGSYYLNYRGFDQLQIAANVSEYNMGLNLSVLQGNDTLLSVMDKSLKSISEKKKQVIINEWVTVTYEHGVDMSQVWQIAGYCALAVLIVIIVIIIWNRSLKKEMRRREQAEKQLQESFDEIQLQKDQLDERNKEITDSINYAERIQRSFLAVDELLNANLNDYFVYFNPKEAVSGDFYWAGKLNNGNFALVNADSTGHGVPGAIMSILNISSIEHAVDKNISNPAEIFNQTRKTIIERLKKDGSEEGGKDGMDASLISFNKDKTKMTYVAAQNPIWIIRNGELIEIKPEKMPVGKHDNDHVPFKGGEFDLLKGDQIYTLTDGFQDQFGGPKGKKFMVKKMREYVLSISNLSMADQYEGIVEAFTNWKGEIEQVDDVCVIGVRI